MSNKSPPFDSPYYSPSEASNGRQYIESMADGSKRSVNWQPPDFAAIQTGSAGVAKPAAHPKSVASKVVLYLNVPFSEKDEAKALGARWDAAKKKWYVPAGKDPEQFSRWSID